LNCEVFNFAYAALELQMESRQVDTCRAVFVPSTRTDRLWYGSGINAHAHIQLCVRNPECILGTWLVKPEEVPDDDEVDQLDIDQEEDPGATAEAHSGGADLEGQAGSEEHDA
jgi:hypothetical protein